MSSKKKKKLIEEDIDLEVNDLQEETPKKRNVIIYSLSGASFTVDGSNLTSDKITEDHILKNIFKGKDLSEISFTKITEKSFKDLDGKMTEDIRVYFSTSTTDIWNYNPIMSAFMGTLIYSSALVFVAESEMEDCEEDLVPLDNEFFIEIVAGFIQTCAQYAYGSIISDENKKREHVKSPMFKLSKIQYVMSMLPNAKETADIRPGKDKSRLDTFWRENYVGKYIPDFVFNDLVFFDEEEKDYIKGYVMMKPGMMTLYSPDTGKAKLFFTQTTPEQFRNLSEKITEGIEDLGDDPKKEEIEKVKEEILQKLYS